MAGPWIAYVALELVHWQHLQLLLDAFYRPQPRDVFELVVVASRRL